MIDEMLCYNNFEGESEGHNIVAGALEELSR